MLVSWIFISSYTIIYFFRKEIYLFKCLYFSEYDIRMPLYVFWLRKGSLIKYVRIWCGDGESHPKWIQLRTEGEVDVTSHVYVHTYTLFSCFWWQFSLLVFGFICINLTLPLFKKHVLVRRGYFYPARSISAIMKRAFFT